MKPPASAFKKGYKDSMENSVMDKSNLESFARFIAHVQGDGCFSKERDTIRYFNQEMDLINDFSKSVHAVFGINCGKIYHGKTCLHIGFRNKKIAKGLSEYSFGSKNWFVPAFVFEGSKKVIAAYLQAFFDDEGSAVFSKRKWGHNRSVQMQSINKNGLRQLRALLLTLGILAKLNGPYKEKYYELKITGKENLIKFSKEVNFVHKRKRENLKNAIETYQH
jgi:intein/homing endonuclease